MSQVTAAELLRRPSRFDIPSGRYPTWAPPVIANGQLFIREQDRLMAFDIQAR